MTTHITRFHRFLTAIALTLAASSVASAADTAVGQDLLPVFARAHQGKPLRYVALGGSITQGGDGWIGPWLREQFPKSQVTLINSGMSATGSALGIFRAERDIIDYQPDLVAIEYCVNDGGLSDEDAIRFNETLVVRLKSLPHPPAIIFIEAASEHGVNLQRHRKVAQHYGLLEVDTQQAVDAELKKTGKPWTEFFGDAVHPNKAGNAFYTQIISGRLQPYVESARTGDHPAQPVKLPAPLSNKPLLLDACMVPLQGMRAPGWSTENSLQQWWGRFFQGTLVGKDPGATLTINFRGTAVSLFYALQPEFGSFYANVDGQQPLHVFANSRTGYAYTMIAQDLAPTEHTLTVTLPPVSPPLATPVNGPVKLGYLMVAGGSTASATSPTAGPFTPAVLRQLTFKPVAASDWSWTGPYNLGDPAALDAKEFIRKPFALEQGKTADIRWQSVPASDKPWVDIRKLSNSDKPAMIYAKATIRSDRAGTALLGIAADYFAVATLNGQPIVTFDGPHGGAQSPTYLPVTLKQGDNELLLKVGAGSAGFGFSASVGMIPEPTTK